MKSVALVPYCPLPADTGGKVEMWKHLEVLRELGHCTLASACTKPVGDGWTSPRLRKTQDLGFEVEFREKSVTRSWKMFLGVLYGAVFKVLRFEKAFGHSNPYHRYAFPRDWWYRLTADADLSVVFYSYWAHLPHACPQIVALLDLWSSYMWEGPKREVGDLKTTDLVVVISKNEEAALREMGVSKTLWSPPAIPQKVYPDSNAVGMVGSASPVNREGLRWLESAFTQRVPEIWVYGNLSQHVRRTNLVPVGPYESDEEPYRRCGVILITTAMGMGVQIKSIEALASGRAIVARRGSVRGIPLDEKAWIEVQSPSEMLDWARTLAEDQKLRNEWANKAREYYRRYLDRDSILSSLKDHYSRIC